MKLMEGKIKKFFLNFNRFNKPAVLSACPVAKRSLWFGAVFFFVFLGLILPFQFAQAGFLDILASIPVMIINLSLQVILAISNLIFGLAALILGWVVGPYFTSLPYTYGGIVDIGWPIVRDFVNMFFIIALVIIGLATALRIKEYQAQKALPLLIIIAILINFTPVISGLIVDASNILMNFFLKELTGGRAFINFMGMQFSSLWQVFSYPFDFRSQVTALGKTIVMIIFDWVAAYIFLLYSFLFIMRYVMIWALVIISPIAFFSKLFPGAEKYLFKSILGWGEWWKQFIEWSLVGVIAGFFLYLAEQLMRLAPGMISGLPPGEGWIGNPIVEFVNNFLPWMVVLVFLWLGYKITKETSAMGAQGLIKAVDTGLKMAATAAVVAATGGAAAGLAAKGLAGAARGAQRMEAAAAKLPGGKVWSKPFTKPISWATRGMEKVAAPPLLEYAAKTRRVPEADLKKIDGMSGTEAEDYIKAKTAMLPKGIAERQRLQYMARMADKETLEHSGFAGETGEAATLANKTLEEENPYLQKEAHSILKSTGGMSEEALVHSKLVGMPDKTDEDRKARKEKENEIRNEIQETHKTIQDREGKDEYTIQVALKLKYITKEEAISEDPSVKARALATAKANVTEQDLRNEAAAVTYVKQFKPEDIKKIIDPDTFATRVGITLGNPRNLQRIQDNFGLKKFKAVIEGRGGLNDVTNTPEKLDYFSRKVNPALAQAIFRSPAYREIDLEARKHMLDPNDQPTTNPDDFERRTEIQKKLETAPPALQSFNRLHIQAIKHQRRIEELEMRGQPTTQREKLLDSNLEEIASRWPQIEKNEKLRKGWIEIEKLRNPRQAEVLERDVEAGLRIEGILKTEPLLSRFDNLHQLAEEHEQRKMKAAREGRHQAALHWSRYETSARNRIRSMQTRIDRNDRLKTKWEEIERLRGLPKPPKPPRRRPRRGGRRPRGGGPSPRGGGPGGPVPGAGPMPSPPGAPRPPTPPPRVPRPPRPTPAPPPTAAAAPAPEEGGLTPEELATEAVKGALEETRRERRRREGGGRRRR